MRLSLGWLAAGAAAPLQDKPLAQSRPSCSETDRRALRSASLDRRQPLAPRKLTELPPATVT